MRGRCGRYPDLRIIAFEPLTTTRCSTYWIAAYAGS
jgi:hypothetical protein